MIKLNHSIRAKFAVVFLIIAISYLVVGIASFHQITQLKNLIDLSYSNNIQIASNQQLLVVLEKIETNVDRFFTVGPQEYSDNALTQVEQAITLSQTIYSQEPSTSNHDHSNHIKQLVQELNQEIHVLSKLDRKNSKLTNQQISLLYQKIHQTIEKSKSIQEEILTLSSQNTQKQQDLVASISRQFLILGLSLTLATLAAFSVLRNFILQPINKLKEGSKQLSAGNLNHQVDIKSKDEFGQLAKTFNTMSSQINHTTQKLKEEKARLLTSINNMPLGFVLVDSRQSVILANSKTNTILNIKGAIKTCDQISKQFSQTQELSKLCSRSQTIKKPIQAKYTRTKNNKHVKVVVSSIQIPGSQRSTIGSIILLEDITEAMLLNQTRDEFFALASHELRTPLTSIRGNASLMLDGLKDKKQNQEKRDMLQDIHFSSIRLIDIVNDFLDASSLEQNKIKFEFTDFSINKLIKDAVHELKDMAAIKNIKLSTIKLESKNELVYADQNRTKQVLINLIANAIKFSPKGVVTIKPSLVKQFIKVSISDQGIGISEDKQKMLFRKFTQAGSNPLTRDSTQSSGLGLYISKLLTEGMKGKIALESSKPGKGTTFYFTLQQSTQKTKTKKA